MGFPISSSLPDEVKQRRDNQTKQKGEEDADSGKEYVYAWGR